MFGFSRGAFTVRTLAGFIAAMRHSSPGLARGEKTFKGLKQRRGDGLPRVSQVLSAGAVEAPSGNPTRAPVNSGSASRSISTVTVRFLGVGHGDEVGLQFWMGDFIT
jgi:hypothetical protein